MNNMLNIPEMIDFYNFYLQKKLLPFWLDRSIDYAYGGYYTCFDNTGSKLASFDKYTWSQGRMVWILSKLSCMKNDTLSDSDRKRFIELAGLGAKFLMKNCLLENGNCTFIMDRKGKPKLGPNSNEYDTSIFADAFVVCGLSMYARATSDKSTLDFAIKVYKSIIRRIDNNTFKTAPYPDPDGYKSHGLYMVVLNISEELDDALGLFNDAEYKDIKILVKSKMKSSLDEITGNFIRKDGTLLEMLGKDNEEKNTLLGRYTNPGHSIEDMWFVIHAAVRFGRADYIETACKTVKKVFEIGWDKEYGGLLLFADRSGGTPKGSTTGIVGSEMLKKVQNDWDSKLWWPHSESLYTTLLCYEKSQDLNFLELYKKSYDYTFKTFPNPDPSVGEWIQIRNRLGLPVQKVVALPVKDPYHIMRNVILIIELLYRMLELN
jgi:N-acylglucosamine 2-epimerase